jgi:hypothetical protein
MWKAVSPKVNRLSLENVPQIRSKRNWRFARQVRFDFDLDKLSRGEPDHGNSQDFQELCSRLY